MKLIEVAGIVVVLALAVIGVIIYKSKKEKKDIDNITSYDEMVDKIKPKKEEYGCGCY